MKTPDSVEELNWWEYAKPTPEELQQSGGLLVEDWPHARHVRDLALQLFEATLPLHGLDAQAQRMLDRAAFLHNTGMMIDTRRHHKHSFRLINEARLPDFTDEERYEIACVARYHRRALPSKQHVEYAALTRHGRERVSALAALLRIADALDYSHDGRVLRLQADLSACNDKIWTILLWSRSLADLDEELERAYIKADLFEKVFKRKLNLAVAE